MPILGFKKTEVRSRRSEISFNPDLRPPTSDLRPLTSGIDDLNDFYDKEGLTLESASTPMLLKIDTIVERKC